MSQPSIIQENVSLAPFCTYQIGGPADYFVEATTVSQIQKALSWAKEAGHRVFVFGGGSNLLFDDAGFRGLVVRVKLEGIKVEGDRIHAEAGAKMAQVVQAALEAGLTGLEEWTGLPGTVGGAVYGNAGCFGLETQDVLEEAELLMPAHDSDSEDPIYYQLEKHPVEFFEYSYRDSVLKRSDDGLEKPVVLSASFHLEVGDSAKIQAKMREIAVLRMSKQPPGSSTGSFFKNPTDVKVEGKSAGQLIDECGLKGLSVGKIQVSEHHANFIVNRGGATAKEVLELTQKVADEVEKRFSIRLEPEIIFVPAA